MNDIEIQGQTIEPIVNPKDTIVTTDDTKVITDEESLVGKTVSTVKDDVTKVVIGLVIGASATFGLTPDSKLEESVTVPDYNPQVSLEEQVVRIETPKLDVIESTQAEIDTRIARLQTKLEALQSARIGIINNAEEGFELQVSRVDKQIESTQSTIDMENRAKQKNQTALDKL